MVLNKSKRRCTSRWYYSSPKPKCVYEASLICSYLVRPRTLRICRALSFLPAVLRRIILQVPALSTYVVRLQETEWVIGTECVRACVRCCCCSHIRYLLLLYWLLEPATSYQLGYLLARAWPFDLFLQVSVYTYVRIYQAPNDTSASDLEDAIVVRVVAV